MRNTKNSYFYTPGVFLHHRQFQEAYFHIRRGDVKSRFSRNTPGVQKDSSKSHAIILRWRKMNPTGAEVLTPCKFEQSDVFLR